MSDFKPYLHSAHIEGYKSIVSCDVTFKPGLNIIIGKNGTGKTNLLEGITIAGSNYVAVDFRPPLYFNSKICFKSSYWGSKMLEMEHLENKLKRGYQKVEGSEGFRFHWIDSNGSILEEKEDKAFSKAVVVALFRHGRILPLRFLEQLSFGWKIRPNKVEFLNNEEYEDHLVLDGLDLEVFFSLSYLVERLDFDQFDIKDSILEAINSELQKFISSVLPDIRAYSPVSNFRVSRGQIQEGMLDNEFIVNGFQFEWELNGKFHTFDLLSDGTKRIISLILLLSGSEFMEVRPSDPENIVFFLLEEPELGIHPHQLHKLMTFIKEQSDNKQIILTTHSPQVLDVLGKEELDRIIIAEFDPKNGSTFRHLTEKEAKKARFIMEEEPLSSYWRYSDLERSLSVR